MQTKHTPGPWGNGPYCEVKLPDQSQRIFMPGNSAAWVTGENKEANARLIALAPEMAEVIKKYVAIADNDYALSELPKTDAEARAILNKLEG